MRAALYTRVSTRDKGQDTANQLDQLRDLCRTRSWEIVAEYDDHDTGGKPNRTHSGRSIDSRERAPSKRSNT